MKTEPLVTVVIPHHGNTRFLRESLNSVIAQDYQHIKILLVLDRPTEEVYDFLVNFDNLKMIQVIVSDAPGLVNSLNYAMGFVESGLVARFDSDDIMGAKRISMQAKHFSISRNLGALGGQLVEIDDYGQQIRDIRYPFSNFELKLRINLSSPIAHTALMLPIDAFKEAGGYFVEDFPAEDFGLLKRISSNWDLGNLRETLGKYRIHESSTSSTRKYEQIAKSLEIALESKNSRLIKKATSVILQSQGHFGLKSLGLLALHSPMKVLKFVLHLCIFRFRNKSFS
jgi:glycosyltransferase involved in cell wall biosynthesis